MSEGVEWTLHCCTVLAALPVLQFLSLGYLLEAGGRVARSGRLREGFIGVRTAAATHNAIDASWLVRTDHPASSLHVQQTDCR